MRLRHGTKQCPVCAARSRTPFCSTTSRKAFAQGITREAQLAAEMETYSWSWKNSFDLQGQQA